jgi:hypothetical protein
MKDTPRQLSKQLTCQFSFSLTLTLVSTGKSGSRPPSYAACFATLALRRALRRCPNCELRKPRKRSADGVSISFAAEQMGAWTSTVTFEVDDFIVLLCVERGKGC